MRWLAACLVLLCGCGLSPSERLDTLFDAARADLRAGELAKAQMAAERGVSLAGTRGDAIFQWRFRLLHCEILLNNGRAEEVLAQAEDAMPQSAPFAPLSARQKMLQSQALAILGRAREAAAMLAEAQSAAELAHAGDVLAEIETVRGLQFYRAQRYEDAEAALRSAQARARSLGSVFLEAGALINLGMIRFRRHRFDEAAGYFEQTSQLAGTQSQTLYSAAQGNLAMCYTQLGEFDRAIEIHLQSTARLERSGAKYFLPDALGETGRAYMYRGDLKTAIPYMQRALSLASEMKDAPKAALWAGNLSAVYTELGDWRNAATLNQEAIRLKTAANSKTLFYNTVNSAGIAAGLGQRAEAARLYLDAIAAGNDDPSVVWQAQEGLGRLALLDRQPEAAARHFEAAIGVVEKTRSDLLRTELKLPFLARLIRLYQQYVDTLIEQKQYGRALAVADSSRAQVLAERYGSAPVRRLLPDAFQTLARDRQSVLLSYWLDAAHSHAWVVTPSEIHHIQLPPAGEIAPLVAQYQGAIERQLADPMRTRIAAGEELYRILVEPVRPWIPAGSRVTVVPDGALHGLNLEALPLPGATPRYWIEDVTISIAPSLALLGGRPVQAVPAAAPRSLLLMGDPITQDPAFPELTYAAREIDSVTRGFGSTDQVVLRRGAATSQAYRNAQPVRFWAIHFTAHATANRESPLDSAVLLSGGKLYARDVMELPLTADLVTVSACRGVGLRTYSGEGLVGFAWAFLHAGARHVIAGLWDVNDQSTSALMDVLYREVAAGKGSSEALRDAKLAMIESRGNLRKPYYWAPFQLYTVAP